MLVIPEPVIYSLLNLFICLSRNVFPKYLPKSVSFSATVKKIFPKKDMSRRIPPYCTTIDNLVFENFILGDELFAKALRIFETCISVNNLC